MTAPTERELRELLATSCKILYRLGLSDYLGHPSARVAGTNRVVIKPRHSPKIRGMDRMSADDMIVVDLDGNLLEGDHNPPSEQWIHLGVYRARPDVLSVVHTHQPMSNLCGIAGIPIQPVLHVQGPLVERPVPVWPNSQLVVNAELGGSMAEALGDHQVCILQGHGIISVSTSVQQATLGAIHLEHLAEACFKIAQTGREPRVIPPDQLEALKRDLNPTGGRWAYYCEVAGVDPGH